MWSTQHTFIAKNLMICSVIWVRDQRPKPKSVPTNLMHSLDLSARCVSNANPRKMERNQQTTKYFLEQLEPQCRELILDKSRRYLLYIVIRKLYYF